MTVFHRFAAPATPGIGLDESPLLESWNAADHADQVALSCYLDRTVERLGPQLGAAADPLSFSLLVGLDPSVPLLHQRDLDNFLLPLARRLREAGRRVVSAHGSKAHAAESLVAVDQAHLEPLPTARPLGTAEVSVSYQRQEYKQAVRDALSGAAPLSDGPVRVELAFSVGEDRNWLALWKPTIDALGPILGHDPGAAEWNPRDGRITQLALHCEMDPTRRWDVGVAISAASLVFVPDAGGEAALLDFALSYDGYADADVDWLGELAQRVEVAWESAGVLPDDLLDLRRALFFLQRQHRATDDPRPFGGIPLVHALVAELRDRAPAGLIRQDPNL